MYIGGIQGTPRGSPREPRESLCTPWGSPQGTWEPRGHPGTPEPHGDTQGYTPKTPWADWWGQLWE